MDDHSDLLQKLSYVFEDTKQIFLSMYQPMKGIYVHCGCSLIQMFSFVFEQCKQKLMFIYHTLTVVDLNCGSCITQRLSSIFELCKLKLMPTYQKFTHMTMSDDSYLMHKTFSVFDQCKQKALSIYEAVTHVYMNCDSSLMQKLFSVFKPIKQSYLLFKHQRLKPIDMNRGSTLMEKLSSAIKDHKWKLLIALACFGSVCYFCTRKKNTRKPKKEVFLESPEKDYELWNLQVLEKFDIENQLQKINQLRTSARRKALEYRKKKGSFKISDLDSSSSTFLDVKDKVIKYIQPTNTWHLEVISVQEVFNANLLEDFHLCQANLFEPSNSQEKFLGTNAKACRNIIENGFRQHFNYGQQQSFGLGIYFAGDSSKSAQQIYTKGSNILILCDVLLGKEMKVSTSQYTINYYTIRSLGYDSLFAPADTKSAGGVLFDEFVIYDPRQAYPRYVINYKVKEIGVPARSVISTKFQKHEILRSRSFDKSNELDYHFRLAEAEFRRFCTNRDVVKVTYVINPALESQFLETSKKFAAKYGAGAEEAKPILAFHGTPIEANIESILKNNFHRSYIKRTAYGHGHYFSEFSKTALGYAGRVKALILCKILVGRSQDAIGRTKLARGYDSLRVEKDALGRGKMIIIENEKQILPQYVVHID
ncbi:hypothetical protein QYM36_016789 [Artemia franciscana]|uniref:Poly [ADP-ribose] polymerase n=1 Tax=Artemia franciscana TaxID=6661 RepID=A0AA88H921_ARTSF|nr:hypothetical protein QYM36_016789 [Artemia franciscana]